MKVPTRLGGRLEPRSPNTDCKAGGTRLLQSCRLCFLPKKRGFSREIRLLDQDVNFGIIASRWRYHLVVKGTCEHGQR